MSEMAEAKQMIPDDCELVVIVGLREKGGVACCLLTSNQNLIDLSIVVNSACVSMAVLHCNVLYQWAQACLVSELAECL